MFEVFKLKNGVRGVLVPMAGVESMAMGVYIASGSRHETKQTNGLSHFLEHMAFKGTKKFPTQKETSYLEGLGALQNAWTDVHATAYWCKIPADRWKEGLEVCKELAMCPTIPAQDLEIERGVILEEMNRRWDRPDELVEEKIMETLYPDNPLGWPTLGETEVIKQVKREDFLEFRKQRYTSQALVVVVAGKISEPELIKQQVEAWWQDLESKPAPQAVRVAINQKQPAISLTRQPEAAQIHLEMGWRTFSTADPDHFALAVLNAYLGQGMSSRLFVELREKRGLCYAVNSGGVEWRDTGVWSVYAGVGQEQFYTAVEAIWEEIHRLKSVKLSGEEVAQAQEKIRGPLIFAQENPIAQMEFYARQAIERPEEMLTYAQIIDKIRAVDAEAIQKVAQRVFMIENINLAAVGAVKPEANERLEKILV